MAESGDDKGKPVLWLLARAAARGLPEAFLSVWEKWKDTFTCADFLTVAESGDDKGKTVLWQLAFVSDSQDINKDIRNVITYLLQQYPDLFNATDLKLKIGSYISIEEMLQRSGKWGAESKALIDARNTFFDALTRFKQNLCTIENIKDLAKNVERLGYIHAYYDVGKALDDKAALAENESVEELEGEAAENESVEKLEGEARSAYALVSKNSRHYEKVMSVLQQKYYAYAIVANNLNDRNKHLEKSLEFALKLKESRVDCLRQIARSYITNGETKVSELSEIISDDLLEGFSGDVAAAWCLSIFDHIRELRVLKMQFKDSKDKNIFLEDENSYLENKNASLEDENSHLKAALDSNLRRNNVPIEANK